MITLFYLSLFIHSGVWSMLLQFRPPASTGSFVVAGLFAVAHAVPPSTTSTQPRFNLTYILRPPHVTTTTCPSASSSELTATFAST
jgi:hypothetical protein